MKHSNKLFDRAMAWLLVLVMVLAMMPTVAMAETAQTGFTVTVGETVTTYTDFGSAVTAACAAESALLTLHQDTTNTDSGNFTNGNITLDLNGYTVISRITVGGATLTITDSAETKGTVLNEYGAAVDYESGKLIILDTVDCIGAAEGHSPWYIGRDIDTPDTAGTIGTTGTEDIVIPEGYMALHNNEAITILPALGQTVMLHGHTWVENCLCPKICPDCGASEGEAPGHSIGEDGICTTCGLDPTKTIIINMNDSCGDGWTGNAIEVYENGTLVGTATIDGGYFADWTGDYDASKKYNLRWVKGEYAGECTFKILLGNEEVLNATHGDCEGYTHGQLLYGNCEHSYDEGVVTAPTCDEQGYTTYTCTGCGYSYHADDVRALGHSFDGNGICTVCGFDPAKVITIDMTDSFGDGWTDNAIEIYVDGTLAHTVTIDDGYRATWEGEYDPSKLYQFYWVVGEYPDECAFKIYVGGKKVLVATTKDCNEYLDGWPLYSNCEHSYDEGVVTAPTCEEKGYTTYVCTTCGEGFTDDYVAALGHSKGESEGVVTAPTCTEEGYTTYVCTTCGESLNDNWVARLGHILGADGNCTVCGDLYTVPVWVAYVQIDANNMDDILGDGTASYDPTTNTLTLNGFTYEGDYPIWIESSLNIVLIGENAVVTDYEGIYCAFGYAGDSVEISGTGSLTIDSGDEGIEVVGNGDADLIIGGSVTIEIDSGDDEGIRLNGENSDLTIKDNAKVVIGTEDNPIGEECLYVVPTHNGSLTITDNAFVSVETTDEEGIYVGGEESQSITISGNAKVNVVADEEGLDANTITISGGTVTVSGGTTHAGIYADDLTISGGTIYAEGEGEGIKVENLTISGGKLKVVNGILAGVFDEETGFYEPGTITLTGTKLEGGQIGTLPYEGGNSYTTILDNNGDMATSFTIVTPAVLSFYSISLKGNIAIKYYMSLTDEVLEDETAYMQFTMANGDIIKVPVSEAVETEYDGNTYYVFSCGVAAKEMTDAVKGQFFYDDGSTAEYAYNVKTYADYILANSTNEDLKALVTAMLNYGAASQIHFGYNTDDLANAELETPDYSDVAIEGFNVAAGQGTEQAVFYSASLILNSETTLRFFFTGPITATFNGQELEVKQRGGLYYVDVVGISAKDLDEDVTITISDGVSSADVTYNPMVYCTAVQNDTTGSFDQEMKDLVSALYLYNQVANIYLEEN